MYVLPMKYLAVPF